MPPQCKWIVVKWLGCVKELSCVVVVVRSPHEISRRSEDLEGIYGSVPSADRIGLPARVPNLGKGYIERKAVELKLTGIALNRSKNPIGERTTDRGLHAGRVFFLIKNMFAFLN